MLKKGRGSDPPRNAHDIGSHRYNAKMDESRVRELRRRHAAGETGYALWKETCAQITIAQGAFYRMLNRKSWRHVDA
jgi:hypothetical protein